MLGLVLPPTGCAIILKTKCYQISLKLSCEINRNRYERLFIAFYEHKLFIIYPALNMLPNYERFLAYDLACRGFYEIFQKKKIEEKLDLNNRGKKQKTKNGSMWARPTRW